MPKRVRFDVRAEEGRVAKSFLDLTKRLFGRPVPLDVPLIQLAPVPAKKGSISVPEEWDPSSDELLLAVQEVRRRRGALTEKSPFMASSSVASYWSQATTAPLPSEARGSDLWTSIRPGKREIWSSITYALSAGKKKHVKILVLETSTENKRRLAGPTFHTPQEAHHFWAESKLAWPGDHHPLDLKVVKSEGLLKAWSQVWSADVEACVRTSAESSERFVENFNITSGNLHVRVPKTFVDQLISQTHKETINSNKPSYETMGRGYFFPDEPAEDSDGTDEPETPIFRRVYAFTSLSISLADEEVLKYGFVRSRVKGDQYFVAATPDYDYEQLDEVKAYFAEDKNPYPDFDFDAKWMLREILRDMPQKV